MMVDLKAAHDAMLRRIIDANTDLRERLTTLPVQMVYEADEDVLYVDFGDPQPSATESVENSLYLRVHPETLKLHGIELHHFSRRLPESPPLRALLALIVHMAAPADRTLEEIPGQVAQRIRELLPA